MLRIDINAASLDKFISHFDKKCEAVNKQVTTSLANMNARLESIESGKRAGTEKPAQQFNQGRKYYHQPHTPKGIKLILGIVTDMASPDIIGETVPRGLIQIPRKLQFRRMLTHQQPLELILGLTINGITIPKEMRAAK